MFTGYKYSIAGVLFLLNTGHQALIAQQLRSLSLFPHYGFIFVHSDDVENTRDSRPFGLQFDLSVQRTDQTSYDLCRCSPRQGFSLYYFNYDNDILGQSLSPAYFLEPTFRLGAKLSYAFRGTVGLSFLNNPHHPKKNPDNQSYSTHVSALLGLSSGLDFRLKQNFDLQFRLNYLHISNGGIKDPNKGINWPTLSLGLSYKPAKSQSSAEYEASRVSKTPYLRWAFSGLLSSRIAAVGDKQRYFVYGLGAGLSRQVNSLSAITLAGEFHYDKALEERYRRAGEPEQAAFAGLLAGHEFLLGRFIFSQELGYYLFKPKPLDYGFYHRWGLSYYLNRHVLLGVNLKAHRQVAHFLDFRISYFMRRALKPN